ncbi:MAG: shikimate dehydrogenase [Candidatus Omnitrophica bacterium]|nr:shikimate dehydrogenase [Candidatus Omnitrophota bacterium]
MTKSTYGLVGYPLGHSLSPVMHNTAFKELDVEAVYVLFPMKKEELKPFFDDLKSPDSPIFGLNVTVPHKENVIPLLDSLDAFAEKVGAVNTVVITNKRKLIGYNTDGPGFLAHLTECGFNPKDKRIAILGAGGASRALISAFCLLPEKPECIKVYDIDAERAAHLIRDLGERMDISPVKIVSSIDDLNIEIADLLVNATPVGMKAEDVALVSEELLHAHMMVYDLVYNPSETALLKMARQKGAKAVNGLKMLFYQGVLAFQRWGEVQLSDQIKKRMWEELEKASQSH